MARKFLTPIDLTKLELQNAAIQNLATDPENPVTGQIYYNTSDKKLKVYNGTSWTTVGNTEEEIEDYVSGLIVAGGGISISYDDEANSLTIANTGVTSLAGTTDEITVSASAGSVTIGLPDNVQVSGDLTVGGNLTISGSATYINTEVIELADNTIILNSNATSATQNAGIEVERGEEEENVSILWVENNDQWMLTNDGTNFHEITRKFSYEVGDGSNTSFSVDHYLGTRNVTVQVYDVVTYETVEVDVVRTSESRIDVTFASAPGNSAYKVVIIG